MLCLLRLRAKPLPVTGVAEELCFADAPSLDGARRMRRNCRAATALECALFGLAFAAEEGKRRHDCDGDYYDDFWADAVHMPNAQTQPTPRRSEAEAWGSAGVPC